MFFAIFLDAAAGKIKSELIISTPTHLIETVTTIAISIINKFLKNLTLHCLLEARSELMLESKSLLKATTHIAITNIKTMNSRPISDLLMDNISPIRYDEYFEKPPLNDNKTIPIDMPIDENTPIIVSEDETSDSITNDIRSAKTMANPIIDTM